MRSEAVPLDRVWVERLQQPWRNAEEGLASAAKAVDALVLLGERDEVVVRRYSHDPNDKRTLEREIRLRWIEASRSDRILSMPHGGVAESR